MNDGKPKRVVTSGVAHHPEERLIPFRMYQAEQHGKKRLRWIDMKIPEHLVSEDPPVHLFLLLFMRAQKEIALMLRHGIILRTVQVTNMDTRKDMHFPLDMLTDSVLEEYELNELPEQLREWPPRA